MKLGLSIGYSGAELRLPVDKVLLAERLGFDSVWTAEAYGSDAITPLAYLGYHDTVDKAPFDHINGAEAFRHKVDPTAFTEAAHAPRSASRGSSLRRIAVGLRLRRVGLGRHLIHGAIP